MSQGGPTVKSDTKLRILLTESRIVIYPEHGTGPSEMLSIEQIQLGIPNRVGPVSRRGN